MAEQVLEAQCLQKVVVEERDADGKINRSELSTSLSLKKEMGNARLVSDDAMLWVAHGQLHKKPTNSDQQYITVTNPNGKRSFSFFLASNPDTDAFLHELQAQVDGKSGLEAKRKKRKIRKQLVESQSSGFVPIVNPLLTPTKRRLSDTTNSPRLAPPLPMAVSTVSEAHGVFPSPSKSPFRSPFRSPFSKKSTPSPRVATPIVSLSSLPPKSPAIGPSATPTPSSASSVSAPSPRREWLSPARGDPARVRVQLTPPAIQRTPTTARSRDSSEKENTPLRSKGIVANKRVRSLQRMLDDVPREEVEHTAGARPPPVRSPYFLSPTNAREMSPIRRPSPAKKLRSPTMPLGELHQNTTPPLRPLSANRTPGSNPQSGTSDSGLRKVTHGLLNLGNFCYMNAIVQSLATIPGFIDHLQKDEWILPVIKKRLSTTGVERSSKEIAQLLMTWRHAEPTDRWAVQDKLAQLLQQVIDGSETAINPEPLKNVMGQRNPRFASHFQQDAHEFLLHLVTEYEKELIEAVEGVVKTANEGRESAEAAAPQPEPAPSEQPSAPKKSSLLNFFRLSKKVEDTTNSDSTNTVISGEPSGADTPGETKPNDQEALLAELYPAECFRTELYRTLTCCSCQYSRRQVEQFYDFSLDLPFVPLPDPPTQELETKPLQPTKQCHCGMDAVIVESAGDRFYCCAKSSCSLRDKVELAPKLEPTTEESTDSTTAVEPAPLLTSPSQPVMGHPAFNSIRIPDLLRDQFKPETLELTCEKCKDGREAVARYEVKTLPRVLVLHLKRFEVNPHTGSLYKRCDLVEAPKDLFPVENIHQCDGSNPSEVGKLGNPRYTVKSVIHHLGRTVDEGHYVADVCSPRGDWRRRNDTHETLIGEDYALRASRSQESCYMMFYVLAQPTDAEERDKENLSTSTPTTRSPIVTTTPDSPASLVGRRRELTPPRRNSSTVSKSLHELL